MNNKVVYLLKDSEGIVRYVGSGTVIRANSTQPRSGRGKAYAEFVKANGKPEVEIIADRLSTTEAEDLESIVPEIDKTDKTTEVTYSIQDIEAAFEHLNWLDSSKDILLEALKVVTDSEYKEYLRLKQKYEGE